MNCFLIVIIVSLSSICLLQTNASNQDSNSGDKSRHFASLLVRKFSKFQLHALNLDEFKKLVVDVESVVTGLVKMGPRQGIDQPSVLDEPNHTKCINLESLLAQYRFDKKTRFTVRDVMFLSSGLLYELANGCNNNPDFTPIDGEQSGQDVVEDDHGNNIHDHADQNDDSHKDHDHANHNDGSHKGHEHHDHDDHNDGSHKVHEHHDNDDSHKVHEHHDHNEHNDGSHENHEHHVHDDHNDGSHKSHEHHVHDDHNDGSHKDHVHDHGDDNDNNHHNTHGQDNQGTGHIHHHRNDELEQNRTHQDKHRHEDTHSNGNHTEGLLSSVSLKVWGYSLLAVTALSLVGLLSVVVIPLMSKVFYHSLIHFLVAMAIGAMLGDAFLHLLPHAFSEKRHGLEAENHHENHDNHGNHSNHSHSETVWKGVCGLAAVVCFYIVERVLTIISERNIRRKAQSIAVSRKLSTHEHSDYQACESMVFYVDSRDHAQSKPNHSSISQTISEPRSSEETSGESKTPFFGICNHSHGGPGHAHVADGLPQTVAAIAWMVIVGDGIHNFSDGLALGTAFSNSIAGGLSTSIAILCHELPHEIGDFALLLQAGMSVRQAVIYNCMSSLLCVVGMVAGILLGNIHQVALWVFAAIAGMFIYIALVDMLPELLKSEDRNGSHGYRRMLLHLAGISVGVGIMTLIALYEAQLTHIIQL